MCRSSCKGGLDVTVVEKNQRVGGCLQSYRRDNAILTQECTSSAVCTKRGNIRRIFDYLGVTEMLNIQNLDFTSDIDIFVDKEKTTHTFALNRGQFVESVSRIFPEEKGNLQNYLKKWTR